MLLLPEAYNLLPSQSRLQNNVLVPVVQLQPPSMAIHHVVGTAHLPLASGPPPLPIDASVVAPPPGGDLAAAAPGNGVGAAEVAPAPSGGVHVLAVAAPGGGVKVLAAADLSGSVGVLPAAAPRGGVGVLAAAAPISGVGVRLGWLLLPVYLVMKNKYTILYKQNINFMEVH
jgi:hypothetical protein